MRKLSKKEVIRGKEGMALLLVIVSSVILIGLALGILSIARLSENELTGLVTAKEVARANAKLALGLAINDLQVTLGPDQRITANAESVVETEKKGQVLGVWESWRWNPTVTGSPNYGEKKTRFKKWLTSGGKQTEEFDYINKEQQREVKLVGRKTLGLKEGEEGELVDKQISAPIEEIEIDGAKGEIAYAILDESQKADISLIRENQEEGEELLKYQISILRTPDQGGVPYLEGLEELRRPEVIDKLFTLGIAEILGGKKAVRNRFHDLTVGSLGVLSDVVKGGLKKDLTVLFEAESLPSRYADKPIYLEAYQDLLRNGQEEKVPLLKWDYLYSHYNLYKKIDENGELDTNEYRLKDSHYWKENEDKEERVLPVISRVQIFFSITTQLLPSFTRIWLPLRSNLKIFWRDHTKNIEHIYLPYLVVDPIVSLYNPYDVPLKNEHLRVKLTGLPILFCFTKNGYPLRIWNSSDEITAVSESLDEEFGSKKTKDGSGTYYAFTPLISFIRDYAAERSSKVEFSMFISKFDDSNWDLEGGQQSLPREPVVFPAGRGSVYSTWVQPGWTVEWFNKRGDKVHNSGRLWQSDGWFKAFVRPTFFDQDSTQFTQDLDRTGNELGVEMAAGFARRAGYLYEHLSYRIHDGERPINTLTMNWSEIQQITGSAEELNRLKVGSVKPEEIVPNTSKGPDSVPYSLYEKHPWPMAQTNQLWYTDIVNIINPKQKATDYPIIGEIAFFDGQGYPFWEGGGLLLKSGKMVQTNKVKGRDALYLAAYLGLETARSQEELRKFDDKIGALVRAGQLKENEAGKPDIKLELLAGDITYEAAITEIDFFLSDIQKDLGLQERILSEVEYAVTSIPHEFEDRTTGKSPIALMTVELKTTSGQEPFRAESEDLEEGEEKKEKIVAIPVGRLANPTVRIATQDNSSLRQKTLGAYQVVVEGINAFDDGRVQFADDKYAYLGNGREAGTGSTVVPIFSIPRVPLVSLGELSRANLAPFSVGSQAVAPFGDSWAHPMVASNKVANQHSNGTEEVWYLDYPYLLNDALWDGYYFSSAAEDGGQLGKEFTDFLKNQKNLANRNLMAYTTRDSEGLTEELNSLTAEKRSEEIGRHLMQRGVFNVNSISVEAWKALLYRLKNQEVSGVGGKFKSNDGRAPVPRFLPSLGGDAEDGEAQFVGNSGEELTTSASAGFRSMSDEQIERLAEAIVEEIKLRGRTDQAPNLSLAEFVNRRLGEGGGLQVKKGILETALEKSGINELVYDGNNAVEVEREELEELELPNPEALVGNSSEGASGTITQGDLLSALGATMTVRGDTFKVRAYGAAKTDKGKVLARAWCEAVVQRTPEERAILGRRFKVVSFTWLTKRDI